MISRLLTLWVPGHDLQLNLAHFHTLNSHTRPALITVIRSGRCAATVTGSCDCGRGEYGGVWCGIRGQCGQGARRIVVEMIVVIVVKGGAVVEGACEEMIE